MTAISTKALIYCRVSSSKQVSHGDGLRSQETRCREYAGHRGYEVVEAFHDTITGGESVRAGVKALLKFLKAHRRENYIVIIDHIDRFARDIRGHWDCAIC